MTTATPPQSTPQTLPLASAGASKTPLVLTIIAIVWGAIIFLLTIIFQAVAINDFALAFVAMIMAMLPVPILIALVYFLDRFEAEPLWMLIVAFLWGATISILFAGMWNTLNTAILSAFMGQKMGGVLAAPLSAPPVEEISKAIVLFAFFFFKRDEFDGVLDGILYAAMVGLGFAMTENIQYYGKALHQSAGTAALTFLLRSVMGAYGHPLFTSMTGIGLGLSRQSDNPAVKKWAPVIGLFGAMFLHFLWNLSGVFGFLQFIMVYIAVMLPAMAAVLVVVWFSLKRDRQLVHDHLAADLQSGWITLPDLDCLCSIRSRLRASLNAWKTGGLPAWKTRVAYNQLTSELALHRWRVAKGITPQDKAAQLEADYIARLRDLYSKITPLPPPPRP